MNAVAPWVTACVQEPIHTPNAIQSWGALLIARAEDQRVRHASENLVDFLRIEAAAAIGQSLADLLGPDRMASLMARSESRADASGVALLRLATPQQPGLSAALHQLGSLLYVEIEHAPALTDTAPAAGGWAQVRALVDGLRRAGSLAALFATAIAELRRVTGFDRVMVYQFLPDDHGVVLAEDLANGLEPMLGLHFPAIDIPPQARRIFGRLGVRVIPDSSAAPVAMLAASADVGSPDLSLCALRIPSDCHLQYLRNMGSAATATVALTVDHRLWGLLACHNSQPRRLPPAARAMAELIGQVTALMLVTLRDTEARAAAAERGRLLREISAGLATQPHDPATLATALLQQAPSVLKLVAADGLIARLGGRLVTVGQAPEGADAAFLLDALLSCAAPDGAPFACDSLAAALGPEHAPRDSAGALLLPLMQAPGDGIVWLRPEQSQIVRWGGNPAEAINLESRTQRLLPRASFAEWRQEVRGRCLPWLPEHHQAALELRRELDQLLVGYTESLRIARDTADRATRAKSEFLATMSHEIRSPMSGLLGVLELLRATKLDREQNRMADMIHNSASMLLAVLNDILDFSKIEAGALSINPEPTNVRDLVLHAVQPFRVAAAQKGLDVALTIDPGIPDRVSTDPMRLKQILNNLLSNAIKFTAAGRVVVRLDNTGPPEARQLRLSVTDSGIGMSAEVVDRLFSPFMQADGSTTRNFGGTGLGLCISRQLARLLEGELWVTSRPGEGSCFTLTLPLLACDPADPVEVAIPAAKRAAAPSGQRVLIVDDDPTIRWLSLRQLEKLGFDTDSADDGESGLQKLRSRHYDLVLTDCHMPRMDGVALTRQVRGDADPALRAMPIIGLTADVTEYQRALCTEAGMTELAIKPLTVDRLSTLLSQYMGRASQPPSPPGIPTLQDIAFDDQIFRSIFSPGDPEGADWLNGFLVAARAECQGLAELLAEAPPPLASVNRLAHRLAGAAFSTGAMRLGAAARALEAEAGAADSTRLGPLFGTVQDEMAACARAMGDFLLRADATDDVVYNI